MHSNKSSKDPMQYRKSNIDREPVNERGGGSRVTNVAHTEAALMAGKAYESSHEGHNKQYDTFEEYLQNADHMKHEGTPSRGARIDRELENEDREQIAQKDSMRAQKAMEKEMKGHHDENHRGHHHLE
ncbi:hypothetical protein INT44_000871 [Umbelopsis vinacea]|uniref:Uncharacterized protein n=1 Tax=Umbelopsis vinacea TaxID=44442 RepID=A0A8H7UM00_9FUNG|nr:hypothetical protein INT44_000871 [Umbelopsis vinacea]